MSFDADSPLAFVGVYFTIVGSFLGAIELVWCIGLILILFTSG
jgi:hypothetical protein